MIRPALPRRARRAAHAALAALALAAAPPALAISRTFVASFGNDANVATNCGLTTPCRGFTVALSVTDAGGEIVVLDSAGYGAVTIGKSVSITVPAGIYAGISVLAGDGITVNGAGVSVTLTNLTINGQGGTHGIRFVQGARLDVVGCQVVGMGGDGVRVEGPGTVSLRGSAIRGSAQNGVSVNAAAAVTLVRTRIQSSGANGISMGGGSAGSAARTLVFDNGLFGISASQTVAGTTRIALDDVVVSDNDAATGVYAEGIGASAIAQVDVTRSLVTRNFNGAYAFSQAGGTAAIASTGSGIVENLQVGVTTATTGGTTTVRTSRNGVFRNAVAGLLRSSGSLFTSGQNYVRDNDGGDSFGAQADSLM